ncbi:O-antigen ligase family protein [Flagellimonas halotolerans]|nr:MULTISPECIES: O-antigen ligase family protein [unclassified Allomuricauda]MEC3966153.1 O-antigen ligase family protein [Muricauda sp. SYSU M86414]
MQLDLDYFSSDISWGLDRASGLYGDANNACLVSIISYVFLKFTDFGNLPFKSLIKLILTLLISYSVILTFSTTGYLVFVFVVILCNYKYLSKRNILASMFALPLLYLIIINLTWLTAGLNLNERQQSKIVNFENIFSFKFDQIDNSGRFEHIDNVIGKLYENPFFGHGFDFGLNHLTHNTYLNIWLESGIIGLLVLIVVLAIYFSRAIKVEKKTKYFSLAILFAVSIFMLSLQTVINQPYIMVVLTYVGVLIDKGLIKKNDERFS